MSTEGSPLLVNGDHRPIHPPPTRSSRAFEGVRGFLELGVGIGLEVFLFTRDNLEGGWKWPGAGFGGLLALDGAQRIYRAIFPVQSPAHPLDVEERVGDPVGLVAAGSREIEQINRIQGLLEGGTVVDKVRATVRALATANSERDAAQGQVRTLNDQKASLERELSSERATVEAIAKLPGLREGTTLPGRVQATLLALEAVRGELLATKDRVGGAEADAQELARIRRELAETKGALDTVQAEARSATRLKDLANEELVEAKARFERQIKDLEGTISGLRSTQQSPGIEDPSEGLKTDLAAAKRQVEELEAELAAARKAHTAEKSSLEARLAEAEHAAEEARGQLENASARHEAAQGKLSGELEALKLQLDKNARKHKDALRDLSATVEGLESQLESAKRDAASAQSEAAQSARKIEGLEGQIESLLPLESQVAEIAGQYQDLLAKAQASHAELLILVNELNLIMGAIHGIGKHLVDGSREEIEPLNPTDFAEDELPLVEELNLIIQTLNSIGGDDSEASSSGGGSPSPFSSPVRTVGQRRQSGGFSARKLTFAGSTDESSSSGPSPAGPFERRRGGGFSGAQLSFKNSGDDSSSGGDDA